MCAVTDGIDISYNKCLNILDNKVSIPSDEINELKERIAAALRAYENKGLTVVQKDGRIYISLEAKLLFFSTA